MQKIHLFMGFAILLWGTSTAIGQENFRFTQCDPCMPVINPCGPCGNGGLFTPFTFGGWIETGIYGNAHGNRDNGPMHAASHGRTDFQMNQFYLFAEREMNTRRGFDWGGRVDLVYGTDVDVMQNFGDKSFDYNWGTNKHGYGMAAYQLYGTLGYRNLSVKVGKFIGYVGWEEVASKNNIFYSHSYCYMIEPATHSGVLATYELSDRFSFSAGWTAGEDASFRNRFNDNAVLTGFNFSLSDRATVYYWINAGRQNNGEFRGDFRFGEFISHNDYFVQSVCLEWALTNRFTHVLQYNLRNDNLAYAGGKLRSSAYGINNHFLYKLTDRLTAGTRVEWLRDNGGYFDFVNGTSADYWQVTLGLRWDVTDHLSFRPEVRYDWCKGATPFAGETRSYQFSGGGGMVISF